MTSKSVSLYIWPAFDNLPSSSPFCTKVIYALRFAKIPFETMNVTGPNLPKWAIRGKLPVAEIGGAQVEDSTQILRALAARFAGFYPASAKHEARLLEDWADESLTYHMVVQRWIVEENWARFSRNFDMIPKLIRPMILSKIRREVVSALQDRGIGHANARDRAEHFSDALEILEQKLSSRPFLAADQPTAADFAALPSLQIIRNAKFPELAPILAAAKGVSGWMSRLEALVN